MAKPSKVQIVTITSFISASKHSLEVSGIVVVLYIKKQRKRIFEIYFDTYSTLLCKDMESKTMSKG